jgi:hypothetical protein
VTAYGVKSPPRLQPPIRGPRALERVLAFTCWVVLLRHYPELRSSAAPSTLKSCANQPVPKSRTNDKNSTPAPLRLH